MQVVKAPKEFKQTRGMHKFYQVAVLIRVEDNRPEGLWDVTCELEKAIDGYFGNSLIEVGFPSARKWETGPEPIRHEPRWKS